VHPPIAAYDNVTGRAGGELPQADFDAMPAQHRRALLALIEGDIALADRQRYGASPAHAGRALVRPASSRADRASRPSRRRSLTLEAPCHRARAPQRQPLYPRCARWPSGGRRDAERGVPCQIRTRPPRAAVEHGARGLARLL